MGSKSSPPAAPDYAGAAQAQGVANTEAARAGAKLSNPNVISPYGTQTVQYGTPQFDQSGYDQALAAYNSGGIPASGGYKLQDFLAYNQRAAPSGYTDYAKDADIQYQNYLNNAYGDDAATAKNFGQNWGAAPTYVQQGQAPTREQFTTYGGDLDVPTVTQELNPQSQQIFDAQQGTRLGLANLSGDALRTAQGVLNQPFQYNGPGIQTSLQQQGTIFGAPNYGRAQTSVSGGQIQGAPDLFGYGSAGANVQRGQIQDAPQSTTLRNTFEGGGDINSGPTMGQYGFATGLAGDAFGRAGSISGNQYGQASGGPAGNAYGQAGGVSGNAYGQAGGGPAGGAYGQAGNISGSQYGQAGGGPSGNAYGQAGGIYGGQYGQAGGGPAGNAYGLSGGISGGQYGQASGGPSGNAYGLSGGVSGGQYGLASGQLDLSNVANMPINAGMTAQQAIMSRLAPQIERERQAQETQLRNQGLVAGGEAYGNAMTIQNQRENDLKTQAVLQGLGLDLTANQQGFNQALQQGQFGNQAISQNFGQGFQGQQLTNQAIDQNFGRGQAAQQMQNQAIGQNFGQGLQGQQLTNQAIDQNFGRGQSAQQMQNQAISQNFGQGLQGQQLTNQAIGQNFGQGQAAQQMQNQAIGQNFGQGLQAQNQANAAIGQNFGQGQSAQQMQNQAIAQNFGQGYQGQEQQNRAIGQNFAQGQAATQLGNQAIGQNFGQGLQAQNQANAAIGQNFGQGLQGQQLTNQAIGQNYGQGINLANTQNQAQAQRYGQNQGQAQFYNQAQGQQYQQQLAQQAAQNAAQQQGFGQNMNVAELQNQAIQQNQQAALAQQAAANQAQAQGFGQNLSAGQFYNQGQQQDYQNAISRMQAQNQAQNQNFNQGLASAQFGNTAQQQAYQQALYQRELPLNEISALMSGSQIQNPQFPSYSGSQVAPAPIFAGTQAQYNAGLQGYGMENNANNAFQSGLFNLGAAALPLAFSDRRLKSNIERIGTHPLGIGIYEYDIFGRREYGVMADEVLNVKPEAVSLHPSGFMQVDYGRL